MGRLAKEEQTEEIKEAIEEQKEPEKEKISYVPIEMVILEELQNIKLEVQELKIAYKKGFKIQEIINSLAEKDLS